MTNTSAVAQIAIREWTLILSLIFGGCCSAVFTLEKVVSKTPEAGNIVTFVQFLFIAGEGYITFFDSSRPPFFIKKNEVPMRRWIWAIVLFFLTSIMNNSVFIFKISIPIHIIFRSSGTVIVMAVGYVMAKKRYNRIQVISAVFLTVGAVLATLFKETEIFAKRDIEYDPQSTGLSARFTEDVLYLIGLLVLFIAVVLMAVMGLYNEETYRKYGKHWKENVFYCHLFGLPMFLLIWPKVQSEFMELWNYPEVFEVMGVKVPRQLFYLILNVLTQYICIRGVNMLAGNTTALTVSVVLLLRKFTSLLLSMFIFDNTLSLTGSFGAFLVFFGAFLYSYGSTKPKQDANCHTLPIAEHKTKIGLTQLHKNED